MAKNPSMSANAGQHQREREGVGEKAGFLAYRYVASLVQPLAPEILGLEREGPRVAGGVEEDRALADRCQGLEVPTEGAGDRHARQCAEQPPRDGPFRSARA